ncbi:MAG: hypothetical protein ACI3XM_06440 [Eubacteriales bacterium]
MKRMYIRSGIWILLILFLVSCGNESQADRRNGIYIIPGEMRETAAALTESAETTASNDTSAVSAAAGSPSLYPNENETQIQETEAKPDTQTEERTTVQTEAATMPETEAEPPKQESAAQTKPVETDLNEGHTITDITVTSPIAPNSNAVLTAHVLPDTVYSITVYYSSGPSTAKGLTDKTSDADGTVSWEWKVGQRTKAGTYRIVITGGGDSAETTFTVTE